MIRLSLAVRRGLAGDHVDVDWGADLGMQADPDLVRTEGLDRVANLDPAPVELGTARLTDRRRDVGGPDRAEQPAAAARAPPHPHVQPLELRGDDLGVLEAEVIAAQLEGLHVRMRRRAGDDLGVLEAADLPG